MNCKHGGNALDCERCFMGPGVNRAVANAFKRELGVTTLRQAATGTSRTPLRLKNIGSRRSHEFEALLIAAGLRLSWTTSPSKPPLPAPKSAHDRAMARGAERARREKQRRQESVYFLEATGTGLVKIGKATGDPKSRVAWLQTGSAAELRLLHWIEGRNKGDEAALHRRFKHLRVRGEWFRFEGELAEYVKALMAGGKDGL